MSLEAAIQENTAAVRELVAALTTAGALQNAQASAAAASSPAVQAVIKAQKDADVKKSTPMDAGASSAPSGERSASITASSSRVQKSLRDWHEKTAETYAELKDAPADLEHARKAILAINVKIGRAQADAVLARFGVQAVTTKADKKGLDESQYPDFLAMCLEILAGRADATESME